MRLLCVKDGNVYDITLCFDRLFEFSLVVPLFHRYHLSFAVFITFHRALPYTEPSHVRNLKVLDRVFYRPCLPYWTTASAILLICSSPICPICWRSGHGRFNTLMKAAAKETSRPLKLLVISWLPWWVFSLFFDFRLPVHSMRTITITERSNDLFSVFY